LILGGLTFQFPTIADHLLCVVFEVFFILVGLDFYLSVLGRSDRERRRPEPAGRFKWRALSLHLGLDRLAEALEESEACRFLRN